MNDGKYSCSETFQSGKCAKTHVEQVAVPLTPPPVKILKKIPYILKFQIRINLGIKVRSLNSMSRVYTCVIYRRNARPETSCQCLAIYMLYTGRETHVQKHVLSWINKFI